MKKVIFNATILNNKPTGLGVYCRNILSRIDKNLISDILYTDELEIDENKKNTIFKIKGKGKFKSIFLRNYQVEKWIKSNSKDKVIYSPTQHGITAKGSNQIITIHDLMPIYFPKGRYHQYFYYKYILAKKIESSKYVITCSKNTKKDIIKEYNILEDKIKVVYNGFDRSSEPINKEKSRIDILKKFKIENYIFMMGIHYEYKNLHSVIEAFEKIKNKKDTKLVIAGGDNNSYGKLLKQMVKDKNLEDKVIFLGYVSDDDKNKLYQAAKVFIYPSKYEGFGLPVLEAMANETVVLSSNSSSLPEVVGDAAIKFYPDNIEQIKNLLEEVLDFDDEKYQEYVELGKKQIEKFSWDKCANSVEEIIKKLV